MQLKRCLTVPSKPETEPDLIVFDGECVLCSGFFQFMMRHDKANRFQFATAQSPLGQRMYRRLGFNSRDYETNLVVLDGQIYQRLDAFAAAMRGLSRGWSVLSVCRYLPKAVKDPLYNLIARNRYAIFGRRDKCFMPDGETRARFARDGY